MLFQNFRSSGIGKLKSVEQKGVQNLDSGGVRGQGCFSYIQKSGQKCQGKEILENTM